MKTTFLIPLFFLSFPSILLAQNRITVDQEIRDYMELKSKNNGKSVSKGSVSSGSLIHGKLFPYRGDNFIYFDRESYLEGRAFLHEAVRDIILEVYDTLKYQTPTRFYNIMECSNEHGGDLFPHRTHQNGLSVDFMMPLLKNGKPYYGLDTIGINHYYLNFNDSGAYANDPSIKIDFNLIAKHILLLDKTARKYNMAISKVIIKIELKDELFSTPYGKLLEKSGIYVVKGLSPLINSLHDEHYHIDFKAD